MMPETPFIKAFATDCDLSEIGLLWAIGIWKHNYDSVPSILWVHPKELAIADKIVEASFKQLTVLTDPQYHEDWWSVGTRRDRGFGSIGS